MKYELIYHSYANSHITNEQINDIIEMSKINNAKTDITGCLLYNNKQFVHVLEGERSDLEQLFEKISKDSRHSGVQLIRLETIERRMFQKSPLAFDVVGKDDFAYAGAIGMTDLEFVKMDKQTGKNLFAYVAKMINQPIDKTHSRPFGPTA